MTKHQSAPEHPDELPNCSHCGREPVAVVGVVEQEPRMFPIPGDLFYRPSGQIRRILDVDQPEKEGDPVMIRFRVDGEYNRHVTLDVWRSWATQGGAYLVESKH